MFLCFFCLDSKFSVDSSLKFTHRMISVLWPPDPYWLFRVSSAIGINCKSIPSIYSASFAVKISNVWDNKVLCITLKIFSPYNISIGQPRLIQHSIISPLQPLFIPIQFNSAAQSCPTLCNLIDFSTPGFPFHHQLFKPIQLMSIELVMPSNHLILGPPLLLPPSIFPNIRVFSNGSVLGIRWSKYWSFSFRVWYMLVPNLVHHFLPSPLILSSDWMSITKGTLQAPAEDGDFSLSTWITQRSTYSRTPVINWTLNVQQINLLLC